MREVICYIAASLDGYIARPDGSIDWLDAAGGDGGSYEAFARTVDTVLMGARTYRQVTEELAPGAWPYAGMECYVLTHAPQPDRPGIHFANEPAETLVRRLREGPGKGIWVCGGAGLIHPLQRAGLIDVYHVTVLPRLLGGGVRLFPEPGPETALRLESVRRQGDLLECIYRKT